MALQKRTKNRVLSYTLAAVLVVLIAPTIVVLTVFHSLPESSIGDFKKHVARPRGSSAGGSRPRHLDERLPTQLDEGAADSAASRKTLIHSTEDVGTLTAKRQGSELHGAIIRIDGKSSSRSGTSTGTAPSTNKSFGGDGGSAGGTQGIHHMQRHEDWARQGQGQGQGQGVEEHHFQQQQQQQAQTWLDDELQQRLNGEQEAGQEQAGQQQQQQPRKGQEYKRLKPLNGHWSNLLPQGKGTLLPRNKCADQQAAQHCKKWSAEGSCKTNARFMYYNCAASCGLCTVRYLHGSEVPQAAQLVPGVMMPMVGYGTAGLTDLTADAVFTAIRVGYRLVDSAGAREWYREDLVGWGWSASGIKREHLFITSKIHPRHLGYWSTLEVFNEALQDLQTDYVDLMLLHYPDCWGGLCGDSKIEGTWQDSWAALEQLTREKKLRAAGVSNFNLDQMAELVRIATVKPALLQSNSDLLHQDWELQSFCRRHGIQFQAYSSLGGQWLVRTQGQNPVLNHPVVAEVAQRVNKSSAQVALRWALQHGQAVVPRTTKVNRMESNLDLFSFDLTDADMQKLDALDGSLQLTTTSPRHLV